MVKINMSPEKGTIKISKEPTKHFLRTLKSQLTIEYDEDFSYNGALLYAIARNFLDEKTIKTFVQGFRGPGFRSTDPETQETLDPSREKALEKLVDLLINGFTVVEKREIIEKYHQNFEFDKTSLIDMHSDNRITKEELQEELEKIERRESEFQEVVEEIYDVSTLDLNEVEVSTKLKVGTEEV